MPEANLMADDNARPWEEFGRRDTLPHRGRFLFWTSWVSGALSCCLVAPALPICIALLLMAKRDLHAMESGHMDRDGRRLTRKAARYAAVGLFCGLTALVGAAVFFAEVIFE